MRQRTSRAISVQPKTPTALLLAEGLAREQFQIPMRGKFRNWQAMSDDEIVAYARAYCKKKGITKLSELSKGDNSDGGLLFILRKRGLLDKLFERKLSITIVLQGKTFEIPLNNQGHRDWQSLSDNKILEFVRSHILEYKIMKRSELQKKSSDLYYVLIKRKLLDKLFKRKLFEEVTLAGQTFRILLNAEGNRNWKAMPNNEIVAYAKAHIADKGIIKVSDLFRGSNRDIGLYIQLQRRKLLDSVSSDIRVNQETEAL
ncbi:MAG: hypothetical protein Q7S22_05215, partial [Candidatus Micrarchaeota archaeon]|nr:hypothetical protein [Candidatus Micrarchaeota archaeon]